MSITTVLQDMKTIKKGTVNRFLEWVKIKQKQNK